MEVSNNTKFVAHYFNQKTGFVLPNSQQQKYSNRSILSLKKLIFPQITNDRLNQLEIDDESIKYITFASSAQEITNIIMNNLIDFPCPKNTTKEKWDTISLDKRMKFLVITEMTAGVGGNVLNFSKYFKYVNAIEIDTRRCNYLDKNIKLYGFNNVNCYNEDSYKLLVEKDDIVQDIIFFDPPWGGKDYKLHTNLRLNFGDKTTEIVCRNLLQKESTNMIVMKLPNNYDFNYMIEELKEYQVSKYLMDRMTVVVVKKR